MAVLLLQGPLGSFFKHFADALKARDVDVHKINFNGGDEFYCHSDAISFTGASEDWPAFFEQHVKAHNITSVFAYGDCRFYHREIKIICAGLGIRYFAFEEGYLRPNYITLEEGGVNGHSPLVQDGANKVIQAYEPVHSVQGEVVMPGNFIKRLTYAITYYNLAFLKRFRFYKYLHHRSFNPFYEAFCWSRGFARKLIYKLTEPKAKSICKQGAFFLLPLQVHNDMQVEFHSHYNVMEEFIEEVMKSFAKSEACKKGVNLVIKHHPMDRGHAHYLEYIRYLSKKLNIESQVQYIHDQHLPTLLKACKGIVTINSTTALQAFYHQAPVKVTGDAFFDMPGLTHQGSLDSFWEKPDEVDSEFADQFRAYLLDHGQINGSFYCRWDLTIKNTLSYLEKLDVIPKQSSNGVTNKKAKADALA